MNGQRLEEVSRFKPDFTINSSVTDPIEETKRLTGLGFDVVIVSAAAGPAQDQALEMARPAGRVSFFAGLPHDKPHATLNSNALHYKQLSVYGANGSGANQYDTVLRWLSAGLIDLTSVITTELPLEQVEEGFKKVMAGEGLKIVVRPGLA